MSETTHPTIVVHSGVVERGAGQGQVLGFPTANITFADPKIAGTYAGRVEMGGVLYRAAVYADQKRKLLEAHLLDFSGDLYGKNITITLLQKISEEGAFTDVAALQRKIAQDVAAVKNYFKK